MNEIRFPEMKKIADGIHQLPKVDWQAFEAIWQPFNAKRKEILTISGEKEKYLYFVTAGVQRMYYFDDQSREATVLFTYPPSFGGVLDAFLLQQPSRFFYETLTPSHFLRTSFAELDDLMKTRHDIDRLIRKGITHAFSGVLERLVQLQCFSSEEKFRSLLQRSPHILQLVPYKYLANYLGIDPTNFSKLINKIKI
jgi:CRP-like cAMP-binding protein